jgi:crotonobetainyl-CoA:carnitine CoA-transferase CaiB-like acyl-CoA transferase
MAGPLDGLRILDLTTVLMGPYATQILADWGAAVTKIEPPGGDISRGLGPGRTRGMGPTFLHLNRGKRSLALDLKVPAARAVLDRLADRSDVFVSNIRAEALRRLGVDSAAMTARNPGLIVVALTGYGAGGPYAGRPAYDDLVQGQVAIPALTAAADGGPPRYVPLPVVDRVVGMRAAGAILAAVVARARTGRGQSLEVPMFETMAEFVLSDHLQGAAFDPPTGPPGYVRLLSAARRPFPTRDGHLCAMIYTDRHWRDFLSAVGLWDRYRDDPRFADITARTRHTAEVYGVAEAVIATRTTAEWLDLLAAIDVPAGPVADLDALIADPHLRASGFLAPATHPTEGAMVRMGVPERWSDTPVGDPRPAPRLGADAAAVLEEAGYDAEAVGALVRSGAVGGQGG